MTGNPATLRPDGANDRQVLQLEGICLDFAARRVLHGVDLKVAEGEVVVLIGASGSGKTSLLRCINLLNSPTSGRIVIDNETIFDRQAGGGREIAKQEVNRIRAKTGMVFQQFNLFPHMTALQNVMEGPVTVKKEPATAARDKAMQLLKTMGLEQHAEKNFRGSFPAASSSVWRSPAPWPCSRRSCFSTNRHRRSIRSSSVKS